jgi:hypothetical protein
MLHRQWRREVREVGEKKALTTMAHKSMTSDARTDGSSGEWTPRVSETQE